MGCWHHRDPGPCPVDDAPHTTCTSPDYQGTASLRSFSVPIQRPQVLDAAVPPPAAAPPPVADSTFTTATYKRALHGRRTRRIPRTRRTP